MDWGLGGVRPGSPGWTVAGGISEGGPRKEVGVQRATEVRCHLSVILPTFQLLVPMCPDNQPCFLNLNIRKQAYKKSTLWWSYNLYIVNYSNREWISVSRHQTMRGEPFLVPHLFMLPRVSGVLLDALCLLESFLSSLKPPLNSPAQKELPVL